MEFEAAENECVQFRRKASGFQQAVVAPVVDTFRTFVVCPPPEVRAVFQKIQSLAAAWSVPWDRERELIRSQTPFSPSC